MNLNQTYKTFQTVDVSYDRLESLYSRCIPSMVHLFGRRKINNHIINHIHRHCFFKFIIYNFIRDCVLYFVMIQACKGRFGLGTVCGSLIGSKSSNFTTKYQFLTERPGYGSGKDMSDAYWKALGK